MSSDGLRLVELLEVPGDRERHRRVGTFYRPRCHEGVYLMDQVLEGFRLRAEHTADNLIQGVHKRFGLVQKDRNLLVSVVPVMGCQENTGHEVSHPGDGLEVGINVSIGGRERWSSIR